MDQIRRKQNEFSLAVAKSFLSSCVCLYVNLCIVTDCAHTPLHATHLFGWCRAIEARDMFNFRIAWRRKKPSWTEISTGAQKSSFLRISRSTRLKCVARSMVGCVCFTVERLNSLKLDKLNFLHSPALSLLSIIVNSRRRESSRSARKARSRAPEHFSSLIHSSTRVHIPHCYHCLARRRGHVSILMDQ